MYRPFLFFVMFFIPGIVLGNFVKASWIFIVISIVSLIMGMFTQNKTRSVLFGILILFFGAFYYNFMFNRMAGTIATFADKQQTLVGVISDAPTVKKDQITYDVKALYLLEDEEYKGITGKVRLSSLLDDKSTTYRYGDVIKFSGKLKIPQGQRNPNGIDYKAYLMQKGISTTIFSREIEKIGKYKVNFFVAVAFNLRERLTAFYHSNLPLNLSSLMTGIVLGIKDNIPGETMEAVKTGGVAHVLAVSGLHMGIIYAALHLIIHRFRLSNTFSFIIGSITVIFYSFMAGLSPSVIRASVMITVFMLAKVVGRENDPVNSLCLSATILLFLNPLTLFSISFQLSYAAVIGIMLFYSRLKNILKKLPKYLKESLAVIISAQLMVGPILAYYFHNISIIGFLTNLLVVPLISVVLITGLISGITGLFFSSIGSIFVKVPGFLLNIVEKIILVCSRLPFSTIVVPALPPISLVLYFISLALVLDFVSYFDKFQSKYKRACAVALIVFALIPAFLSSSGFEVTFIDVGQGDSIFIKTEGKKVILIDGGGTPPYYSGEFDTGKDIIIPFLHSKGINQIDAVVFTHFDDDHAKGLLSILKSMKVKYVVYGLPEKSWLYEEMLNIAQEKNIEIVQVGRGDKFSIDNTTFEVLNPVEDFPINNSSNNNSVVLKMAYKGMVFLFTGDLEREGEQSLVMSDFNIWSQILKVGHHGSDTSTSEEFLSQVTPTYAIISVGKDNNFGHPSTRVIDLLENSGVTVLRTDLDGGITFKIQGRSVRIYTSIPREL